MKVTTIAWYENTTEIKESFVVCRLLLSAYNVSFIFVPFNIVWSDDSQCFDSEEF